MLSAGLSQVILAEVLCDCSSSQAVVKELRISASPLEQRKFLAESEPYRWEKAPESTTPSTIKPQQIGLFSAFSAGASSTQTSSSVWASAARASPSYWSWNSVNWWVNSSRRGVKAAQFFCRDPKIGIFMKSQSVPVRPAHVPLQGDLKRYLRAQRKSDGMTPDLPTRDLLTLQRMAFEITSGLLHLHENNYIHRSVPPSGRSPSLAPKRQQL